MTVSRSLVVAGALCCLVAPARASAQSGGFERRPFLIVNGGFGAQATAESNAAQLGGPQLSAGVGLRVARSVAVRAEYGGVWFMRNEAEPAVLDCVPGQSCLVRPRTDDLRNAHLLAELDLRLWRDRRAMSYVL